MKTKVIYLLHFLSPLYHAQHYLGSAIDLRKRLNQHWTGKSDTKIIQAFLAKRIPFTLSRTWRGDRKFERRLKNQKNGRRLCPLCKEAK